MGRCRWHCWLKQRSIGFVRIWAPRRRTGTREHLANAYFKGLEGDVRVVDGDTILVTYYNAPTADDLRQAYEDLPARLRAEGVNPRIPWLYGFKLDFCFR